MVSQRVNEDFIYFEVEKKPPRQNPGASAASVSQLACQPVGRSAVRRMVRLQSFRRLRVSKEVATPRQRERDTCVAARELARAALTTRLQKERAFACGHVASGGSEEYFADGWEQCSGQLEGVDDDHELKSELIALRNDVELLVLRHQSELRSSLAGIDGSGAQEQQQQLIQTFVSTFERYSKFISKVLQDSFAPETAPPTPTGQSRPPIGGILRGASPPSARTAQADQAGDNECIAFALLNEASRGSTSQTAIRCTLQASC